MDDLRRFVNWIDWKDFWAWRNGRHRKLMVFSIREVVPIRRVG